VLLTHQPAAVGEEDVTRLRHQRWSDAAIHDAIQVVSYFNYINRIAEAVGVEDEPDWT
jgi:alkylhydroperoxidase family enzyme